MRWQTIRPLEAAALGEDPAPKADWHAATLELLGQGARPVALFHQETPHGTHVWTAFASAPAEPLCITHAIFDSRNRSYPAFSRQAPQMDLFECELYEQTGIRPVDHPWLRPVRSLETGWKDRAADYSFYRVDGNEVHEVGVGPVHAGVIEPGHFRFQCHGEEVLHLEIQLGYQHRAIEALLPKKTPTQQLLMAESAAGDSVIAHATAFCMAIEALAGVSPSLREQAVRGIAAELERIAMHLATLGGVATDIGFGLPSAALGGLRTAIINLSAEICGSRFGRGWIIPGGVRFDPDSSALERIRHILADTLAKFSDIEALLFNAPSALARLEETGTVSTELARDLGLVGLAARASGIAHDVRADFPYGIYRYSSIPSPTLDSGDVYARAKLRALEIHNSAAFILEQVDNLPPAKPKNIPERLARDAFTISLTEGHRGQIAYAVATDSIGKVSSIKITDPSFHNWKGLAVAVRENGISDFPLCNKSFDLSYAGHDL